MLSNQGKYVSLYEIYKRIINEIMYNRQFHQRFFRLTKILKLSQIG